MMKRKLFPKRELSPKRDAIDLDFLMEGAVPEKAPALTMTEHSKVQARYRLDGDIGDVSEYRELLDFLADAGQGDFLEIVFATNGGSVDTTIAILNAMAMTEAHLHGTLISSAMSGGSALFLSCHSHTVCENARFMIHEQSSWGVGGKASDLAAYVEFETRAHKKLMTDIYSGFLSDKELEQFFCGKEFWFLGSEVIERLEKRAEQSSAEMPPKLLS